MPVGLPITISDDNQYRDELKKYFQKYNDWVAEVLDEKMNSSLRLAKENNLWQGIDFIRQELEKIEGNILSAVDNYYSGQIFEAQSKICKLLSELIASDKLGFLLSDIDRSYSTRLLAPFPDLQQTSIDNQKIYEKMNQAPLSFYRGRTGHMERHEEMLHIPLNKRDSVTTQRFSVPGTPCLYLGVSSYDIWRELGRPSFDNFNVSAIRLKPISERGEIKILNLTSNTLFDLGLSHNLRINGVSQNTLNLLLAQIKIWPLVCATSFRVKNSAGSFHSEYIVSHLIMLCLPALKIDGVAYLSKQIESIEEPLALQLMVNVAIPIISSNTKDTYGDICSMIEITDPVNLQEFQGIEQEVEQLPLHSYFGYALNSNKVQTDIIYAKRGTKYRTTTFYRLDNYLCNLGYYTVSNDS